MVIVPKEKPVIDNLNSYYVDIKKLFEHFQGELGAGGVYFKSKEREAIIYFDSSEWLNGVYDRQGTTLVGQHAAEGLLADAQEFNFNLRVYQLDLEGVYFWANLPQALPVYSDLSTEFTNLAALVKKLRTEKLTGAIDVVFTHSRQGGILFFSNGQLVGGSYSWNNGAVPGSQEDLRRLLEYSRKQAAVFNVCKINATQAQSSGMEKRVATGNRRQEGGKVENGETEAEAAPLDPLGAAEKLLQVFEGVVAARGRVRGEFSTLLKRKFVTKVQSYAFLDPFAGELDYRNHRLQYVGAANPDKVVRGLTEVVRELARDLDLNTPLNQELESWRQRYQEEIRQLGLSILE